VANVVDDIEYLVRAAAEGDLHASKQLVERYGNVVWATVRRFRLPDADAQDAVQNTWLRMLEHVGEVREAERLPGWLATTARRECLKIVQQSRREAVGLDGTCTDLAADSSPGPERVNLDREMSGLLWKHLSELPPSGRDMLVTLFASDRPCYAEYARNTGMPIGSIGPRRMRYLRTLRQRLEKAGLGAHAWQ
jgi:RNA polymerase sigma factor (sigma-70 family)